MEHIERLAGQVLKIPFPRRIALQRHKCSLEKLNAFTRPSVKRLILTRGLAKVQKEIDEDQINFSVNYITALIEITIVKELYLQNMLTEDLEVLENRIIYVAEVTNTSVAFDLVDFGVLRIPMLSSGVNQYYTWDNMQKIIDRVMPAVLTMLNSSPITVTNYIYSLIKERLIEPTQS